ncbi:MAG: NAD-dependent epimerase/dehydratase family protein [Anaerolineae bacterium]|nr:NAD-dependent epimerase/dehydratase family protein [Anaerolineae bacterium]
MKYFLTGATGFIGKEVARQLRAQGDEVIALVRNPQKAGDLTAMGVQLAQGDITERDTLRDPMTGVDGVYHVAGWYKIGVRDKSEGLKINVEGTRNVLETMRDLNIPKGVYTSTLAVYSNTHGKRVTEDYHFEGKHLTEYDRTKWLAHYEVAEPLIKQGLPLVIVQPGLVYGIGDTSSVRDTLISYLQRKLPALPAHAAFCWGHIEDTARAHIQAMDKGKTGESYNICGPAHTFVEAINLVEPITGVPTPPLLPSAVFGVMAAVLSVVEMAIPLQGTYTAEAMRINAGATYLGDNSKAKRELGFAPRSLEEGLPPLVIEEMRLLGMTPKTR